MRRSDRCEHGFVDQGRNPECPCPECLPSAYAELRKLDRHIVVAKPKPSPCRPEKPPIEPLGTGRLREQCVAVIRFLADGERTGLRRLAAPGFPISRIYRVVSRLVEFGIVETERRGQREAGRRLTALGFEFLKQIGEEE